MDQNKTAIERAFDLARSGEFDSVTRIKDRLKAEGYAVAQIEGRALSKQLGELIKSAAAAPAPE
jgi:hypothetical protein